MSSLADIRSQPGAGDANPDDMKAFIDVGYITQVSEQRRPFVATAERNMEFSAQAESVDLELCLGPLAVCLCSIVALVHNQILWSVVMASAPVRVEDRLRARRVPLLRVDRSTRHVWHHGIASAPWVLGVAQWMILWCWLWEPDVATVATKVARLECVRDIFLDHDSASCGVDKP